MSDEERQTAEVQKGARRTRAAGERVAELVYEKQLAYGDAASIQRDLWLVLLRQYDTGDGTYRMPKELMDHIPRLTRVFDRISRIVSNPGTDALDEDPWMDLAGDAVVGMVMPRTHRSQYVGVDMASGPDRTVEVPTTLAEQRQAAIENPCGERSPVTGKDCERPAGHGGTHAYVHAGGVLCWTNMDDPRPEPRVDQGAGVRATAGQEHPFGYDGEE